MPDLQPPVTISVQGVLLKIDGQPYCVVLGDPPLDAPGDVMQRGPINLSFGMALLYEPDFILPQLLIDDFGNQYTGEAALDFMLNKGDSYPRADVTGRRASTDQTDTLFLKQIDLAQGLHCLAAVSHQQSLLCRVGAAVWPDALSTRIHTMPANDVRASRLLKLSARCLVVPVHQLSSLPSYLAELAKV